MASVLADQGSRLLKDGKAPPPINTIRFLVEATKYVTFHAVGFLFRFFFFVVHLLDGTYREIRDSRKAENYERSAQVYDVIYAHKLDPCIASNSVNDFIMIHRGFVHPSLVLRDEVSLYDVTKDQAVFAEAPPGEEVWRSRYGAFHTQAQVDNTVRVYVMPIDSFYRLADGLCDPEHLILISNTARCGSTLLMRIFEETGQCVSISEPQVLNFVQEIRGREDDPKIRRLVQAYIRILCKPTSQHHRSYALKLRATSISLIPLIQSLYPDTKQAFIYRDCKPVVKSMMKIWQELPYGYLSITFAWMSGIFFRFILDRARFFEKVKDKRLRYLVPGYGQAAFYWANFIDHYRKYRREGFDIAGIKYEDLARNPEYCITRILQHCDLSPSLVKPALRAMQTDAQANSSLSRKNLEVYKLPEMSKAALDQIELICEVYELAGLGQECVLSGTITRETGGKMREFGGNNGYASVEISTARNVANGVAK